MIPASRSFWAAALPATLTTAPSDAKVLRRIRADPRTKLLPVVVLTSSKEEQDLVASHSLGANSYVRKPVDFNQFVGAVTQSGCYWLLLNETAPRK